MKDKVMIFYNNYFNDWRECNLMIRFNEHVNYQNKIDLQTSPFEGTNWPLEAKSVEGFNGIWGYDLERMNTRTINCFNYIYQRSFQNGWILIMDYDKNSCFRIPTNEDLLCPPKEIDHGVFTNELIVTRANIISTIRIKGDIDIAKKVHEIAETAKLIIPDYINKKKCCYSRQILDNKIHHIMRWDNTANEIQYANFLLNNSINREGTHGLEHSVRVDVFGCILAEESSKADRDVIRWFAYIHDCKRLNDSIDVNHGKRASEYIDTIRKSYLINLSDKQIKQLKKACAYHTIIKKTGDTTIDICFDADRLDLPRVGIKTNPDKMATDIGKKYSLIGYDRLCALYKEMLKDPIYYILSLVEKISNHFVLDKL